MDAYRDQTAPLADYYRSQGVLRSVNGMAPIAEVAKAIDSALDAAPAKKATRKKAVSKAMAGKRTAAAKAAGRKKPSAARPSRVVAAARAAGKPAARAKTTLRKSKSRPRLTRGI
jgi:adenylate kinase